MGDPSPMLPSSRQSSDAMATLRITPRYGNGQSPRDLTIFHVKRAMTAIDCRVEHGRRTADGAFLLQLCPEQSPAAPLQCQMINNVAVKVSMPDHLNLLKGVIYHSELAYMDAAVVEDMLQEEGVVAARKKPQDPHAIIAWNRSTQTVLPATVLVGWDRVRVKPCLPRPKRCYCCQAYGHIADDCTKQPVCSRCGETHDTEHDEPCQKPPHCAACGGPHAATDQACQKWEEEKKIVKIKFEKKISYRDALKKKKEDDRKKKEDEAKKKEEDKEEEEEDQEEKKTTQKPEEQKRKSEEGWKTVSSKKKRQRKKKVDNVVNLEMSEYLLLYSSDPSP